MMIRQKYPWYRSRDVPRTAAERAADINEGFNFSKRNCRAITGKKQ